jgi:hypothetical protein
MLTQEGETSDSSVSKKTQTLQKDKRDREIDQRFTSIRKRMVKVSNEKEVE